MHILHQAINLFIVLDHANKKMFVLFWKLIHFLLGRLGLGVIMRAISQKMFKMSILDISLSITNLRLQPSLPGTSELITQPDMAPRYQEIPGFDFLPDMKLNC